MSDLSGHFSPVKPKYFSSPSTPGNLTGSKRKVKDTVADIYNALQKWLALKAEGTSYIKNISDIKVKHVGSFEDQEQQTLERPKMPEELEDICVKLENLITKMEKIVKKLDSCVMIIKGVDRLERHQRELSNNEEESCLFQTWNLQRFESTVKELHTMYSQELQLKRLVYENVCHSSDRDTLMFYSSAWVHEPYIKDSAGLLIDSMLLETGHKTS